MTLRLVFHLALRQAEAFSRSVLRHVAVQSFPHAAGPRPSTREADGAPVAARSDEAPASIALSFWSADWTPWQALGQLRSAWPGLRFDVCPSYDP